MKYTSVTNKILLFHKIVHKFSHYDYYVNSICNTVVTLNQFEIIAASVYRFNQQNKEKIEIHFDDGYTECINQVVDLLQRFRISATFFVNSCVHDKNGNIWIDKLNFVKYNREHNGSKFYGNRLSKMNHLIDFSQDIHASTIAAQKRMRKYSSEELEGYFELYFPEESKVFMEVQNSLYLHNSDLLALHESGFDIGSHGHYHLLHSSLSDINLKIEIEKSVDSIKKIIGKCTKFAVPFGGIDSYSISTINICFDLGIETVYVTHPVSSKINTIQSRSDQNYSSFYYGNY